MSFYLCSKWSGSQKNLQSRTRVWTCHVFRCFLLYGQERQHWAGNSGSLWPEWVSSSSDMLYKSESQEYVWFVDQADRSLSITAMCYTRLETEIIHIQPIPSEHGFPCTPEIFQLTSMVESLISYTDDRRLGGFVNCLFSLLCKSESVTEIRERQEKIEREKWLRHSSVTQKPVMSEFETTDTSAKMNGIPAGSSWSHGLSILRCFLDTSNSQL